MGLCDAPSGKVYKENVNEDITTCYKYVRGHAIITTRDCDDWYHMFDANGDPIQLDAEGHPPKKMYNRDGVLRKVNGDIGERVVQRPEEFWCIDKGTGIHVNGMWVRNVRQVCPEEFLYYRVHESLPTQVLFVYDELADEWAECSEDFSEHTPKLRELLRPNKETKLFTKNDMIKIANGGFMELAITANIGDAEEGAD